MTLLATPASTTGTVRPGPPPPSDASADRVHEYARAVVAREVVTNRYVRLACERHLRDLETGAERGLRFNRLAAALDVDFFARFLRLEDGSKDGAPFLLADWQAFVVGSLAGWEAWDADSGRWVKRFRDAYVETGKGSGKTPLAAGIGLRGITMPGVAAPEVYSAATARDQSMILWTDAERMLGRSPALQKHIRAMARALVAPAKNGTFKPVSSEARNLHGHRVFRGLIDELHAHPNADVIDALRAGTKGQQDALIFRITNSGFDRRSVCWADHEYSVRILEGQLDDESWFAFVCGLDMCDEHRPSGRPEDGCPGCDQWTDERVWVKANPNIGVSLPLRYLREMVTQAKGKPAIAATVKRLCFCIWTEGSGKWLDAHRFAQLGPDQPAGPVPLGSGRSCWAGLDLASTRDVTAAAFVAPRSTCDAAGHTAEDGTALCYDLRVEFWLPEDNMRDRVDRDHVPYDVWAADGWIHLTPGNVTDYQAIRVRLLELRDGGLNIRGIGNDRWNATQLAIELGQDGFEMYPVDQGITTLNAPSKRLESDIARGMIHHDGNPVMRWMVGNAAAHIDATGNIKPSRQASSEKIDGVAAWVDALHILPVAEAEPEAFIIMGRARR